MAAQLGWPTLQGQHSPGLQCLQELMWLPRKTSMVLMHGSPVYIPRSCLLHLPWKMGSSKCKPTLVLLCLQSCWGCSGSASLLNGNSLGGLSIWRVCRSCCGCPG